MKEDQLTRLRSKLQTEFHAAKRRQDLAGIEFQRLAERVESGGQHGAHRLAKIGTEYIQAMHAYRKGLARLTDFLIKGIVPDDLS